MSERMNCLPLVLHLMLLIDFALSSPPAPVNVSLSSVNFRHILHWDPGPGTPPGTQYKINRRVKRKELKPRPLSTRTSAKLKLPRYLETYVLTVQASYNDTLSQESNKVEFTPYTQTIIGPPKVSLAGCGNCIHINISLPEADEESGFGNMKTFFKGAQFQVFWRKDKEPVEATMTRNTSYTVSNLESGTEYCVQVHTKINYNRNTLPSAWKCTFTSIVEPNRDPVVLGAVAATLILVLGVVMASIYLLYYTGFLCKLKAMPRVLIEAMSQGYTLTPERTIPHQISIGAGTEIRRKRNHPTTPQPGTNSDEEEEDEEEDGENVYIDRDAELSSGESSCQGSVDVSGNSKVSGHSGSLTVEAEVQDTEAKAEGAEVPLMPEGPLTGEAEEVKEEKEEEEEELCESSGNINLFSITLSALAACEEGDKEEEQYTRDSLTDFLKLTNEEPQLHTDSKRPLSHADRPTEWDDQTAVALMLPTREDFTVSSYEGRHEDTLSGGLRTCDGEAQQEESEDEEEFSGYMRHT